MLPKIRKYKYHNEPVNWQGERFDSRRELERWLELRWMEKHNVITDLQRQIKYVLIPTQRDRNGRVVFKECSYIADFVYWDDSGLHVEDIKGVETEVFRIKRKLMYWVHHVKIEVRK